MSSAATPTMASLSHKASGNTSTSRFTFCGFTATTAILS
jgi:hypothetical protein